MNELENERRLTEVEQRALSNSHRIDKMEQQTEAIHDLATSVAVMAGNIERMDESLTSMAKKVSSMELEPGKKWKTVVAMVLELAIGAVAGVLIARIGL